MRQLNSDRSSPIEGLRKMDVSIHADLYIYIYIYMRGIRISKIVPDYCENNSITLTLLDIIIMRKS